MTAHESYMEYLRTREPEWGTWYCPNCDTRHDDPETVTETSCGQCGLIVVLSAPDKAGRMEPYSQGEFCLRKLAFSRGNVSL